MRLMTQEDIARGWSCQSVLLSYTSSATSRGKVEVLLRLCLHWRPHWISLMVQMSSSACRLLTFIASCEVLCIFLKQVKSVLSSCLWSVRSLVRSRIDWMDVCKYWQMPTESHFKWHCGRELLSLTSRHTPPEGSRVIKREKRGHGHWRSLALEHVPF